MPSPTHEMRLIESFDDIVQLAEENRDLFVRYSRGPQCDAREEASEDFESGAVLPGLSVARVAPEPWWQRPTRDWVARRLCQYEWLGADNDRFPWLLTGKVVGQGPDHEPIVCEIVPIAEVGRTALEQAKVVYRQRFDVGRIR
jgi:hypothetical protein